LLRKNTENEFSKISNNINTESVNIDERLNVHISNTRKELATSEREINQRSRALIKEINDHKLHVGAAVEGIGPGLAQTKEEVKRRVEGLASGVKAGSTAFLADKQNTVPVFRKVNLAISQIEAKIAGSAAPHHSSLVREEDVGQSNSKMTGLQSSQSQNSNSIGVSGLSTCSASECAASVINVPDSACTKNISAVSVVTSNGYNNLDEFSLPEFKRSAKQVVTHFLKEIDEYFSVRETPKERKLPHTFKAIENDFANQWFETLYKNVRTYAYFKTTFMNLLQGQMRQTQIRCNTNQEPLDRRMNEMYSEHYIRYANL
jgi:hypothetical protein